MKYAKSAFKHKVKRQRIEEVIRSPETESFMLQGDNEPEMLVGPDSNGNLHEVVIIYQEGEVIVIHAWRAREEWQMEFRERKGLAR